MTERVTPKNSDAGGEDGAEGAVSAEVAEGTEVAEAAEGAEAADAAGSALALLCDALDAAPDVAPDMVGQASQDPLGRGAVIGFDVVQPGESAPLRYYVDTSRLWVEQETGLALPPAEAPEARIWLHPADPHLPALQAVAFHGAAWSLLERIGYENASLPEFVAYRPGRRAVLRTQAERAGRPHTVWVKVVRPRKVEGIVDAHTACADAGLPVPHLEAWSPTGVMILANATGRPAAEVDWDAEAFIDRVDELREQLQTVQVETVVKSVADRLPWYRDLLLRAGDAGQAARVRRIAERAEAVLGGAVPDGEEPDGEVPDGVALDGAVPNRAVRGEDAPAADGQRPRRVVHGDLHFGQLFLATDGQISGMIDVDTVGWGDAGEDPAAFIAHAAVSAQLSSTEVRPRVMRLADVALDRWGGDAHVRGLVAVHLLGHALAAGDRGEAALQQRLYDVADAVLDGGACFGAGRE